ncbi:hypothetical protein LCGC14_0711530 [marine sediment metagenome]|uniref:Uncharacterized protein n=1 Tax=marine sediment metagenome TaxID=412755 RepID=A0A0F9TMG1_9ZZZZ
MTTSGSYTLTANRNSIINGAYRLLGFNEKHGIMPADKIIDASETLNMMGKAWQAEGIGMWLNKDATLFLQTDTESFTIGPTGSHATLTPYSTEIAADADSGASTITVDSDDDITNGDYIGIELDDNSFQWTTVNGTPSSDVVTLTDVLTGDTSENNYVVNYTTKMQRPLEIIEARIRNSSDEDVVLEIVSRTEYMMLTDKDSAGIPNTIYYDPQLTNGVMYVWQVTNDVNNRIVFTAKYPIEIYDAFDDSTPFPDEWFLTLKYNLAVLMMPEYITSQNLSIAHINTLTNRAEELKQTVQSFDASYTSAQFVPNIRGF